ncbi:MAG TPA: plastocyanin/azurin family copper-binding protein [Gemmatimonadaceae bacterium]|jgi:plastocyanin
MRFTRLALVVSTIAFAACGGGESSSNAAATTTDTAAAAGSAATGTAGSASAAPITGTTHVVRMVGDAQGYRYEPANITVKQGDGIRFEMVSGGPHNVAFNPGDIPADVKPQLSANMPNQMTELSSPMFMNAGESYTISFANIKPGAYNYHCTPHLAMNMRGVITVE